MEYILRSFHKAGVFGWLYAASLFHGFHFFAVHYINSSYLERYLTQSDVGLLVAISSALTVLMLATVGVFLAKFGNYKTAIVATALNLLASLGLAFTGNISWAFVFYALHTILVPVTLFSFDIFLENNMKDESQTGSTRGIFLSMALLAALFSPVISGYLVGDDAVYEWAYLASALYLLPVLFIFIWRFRNFVDPAYQVLSFKHMFVAMWRNKDLYHVSAAQFLMRFFFSWYVVYLPIYLHQQVGFSWPEIGVILFVMLIPYVLIEYPAGKVADKYLGEKELMAAGFITAGFSTMAVFFLDTTSIIAWSAVLMVTRVGTALIESMTETYFFKQIDGDDTSILSIFRMLRPLGYTVGPFVAGALLIAMELEHLWIVLGVIMLLGVVHPWKLNDTK